DDGVLDVTPWTSIIDSVGWYDPGFPGSKVYSPAVLTQPQHTPDAASRFYNKLTAQSTTAWYNGEMLPSGGNPDLTATPDPTIASANLPAGATITPGDVNLAAPTTTPPQVGSVVINGGAAQRSRVTQVQVNFDQIVTLPATPESAFQLMRQGDSAAVDLTAS